MTNTKYIHLSIDDVSMVLDDLTRDSSRYTTIVDHPFFEELEELHKEYGCKFSLYLYYRMGSYKVDEVTTKFKSEFQQRSSWLKFAFHAVQPGFNSSIDANADSLNIYLKKTNEAIMRFASVENITHTQRLNRFFATREQLSILHNNGVKILLGADDERESYSLPKMNQVELQNKGMTKYNSLLVLRTDIRLENTWFPEIAIWNYRTKDTLVVFTHEREFGEANKWKLRRIMRILETNKCKYLN